MSESEIRGYCFTPDEVIVDHRGHSRGAALAGKSWDRGKTLRILFLDGPAEYHDRVATHVKTWEECADIKFVCSTDPASEIRVTFTRATGRFYSMIGNDALVCGFPPDNHTMNLGILPDWTLGVDAVEREIRRLILHEFGHSLGLIHEHSSPAAGSFFKDPELVYAYYQRTQGWDRAMVDQNVLTVYSRSQISNLTQFDPDSIMLYQFPPEITSRPTKVNYELSALDKALDRPALSHAGTTGSQDSNAYDNSGCHRLPRGGPLLEPWYASQCGAWRGRKPRYLPLRSRSERDLPDRDFGRKRLGFDSLQRRIVGRCHPDR